jgi:hypothetical protein
VVVEQCALKIHKLDKFILNEELPEWWKKSMIVLIYKKGGKTD